MKHQRYHHQNSCSITWFDFVLTPRPHGQGNDFSHYHRFPISMRNNNKSSFLEHKLLMSFPWWAPLNWIFPDKIFETPSWEQKWTPVTDELLSAHLRSPQQEGHISRYFTATINAEIQLIDESSFFEYIPNHQICFKMNETLRNLLYDNFSFLIFNSSA